MKKLALKDGLELLESGEDISAYGKSIMGDDIDGAEEQKCSDTLDMFAALTGPMGRVIK